MQPFYGINKSFPLFKIRVLFTDYISQVVLRADCWCLVSNSYQPSKPAAIVAVIAGCLSACNRVQLFLILARSHTVKKEKADIFKRYERHRAAQDQLVC